jgi:hypothetical protein
VPTRTTNLRRPIRQEKTKEKEKKNKNRESSQPLYSLWTVSTQEPKKKPAPPHGVGIVAGSRGRRGAGPDHAAAPLLWLRPDLAGGERIGRALASRSLPGPAPLTPRPGRRRRKRLQLMDTPRRFDHHRSPPRKSRARTSKRHGMAWIWISRCWKSQVPSDTGRIEGGKKARDLHRVLRDAR